MTEQSHPAEPSDHEGPPDQFAAGAPDFEGRVSNCSGMHEGPCDPYTAELFALEGTDRWHLRLRRQGATISLEWSQSDSGKTALYELLQGLPEMMTRVGYEAIFKARIADGVDEVEDFLRKRAGD